MTAKPDPVGGPVVMKPSAQSGTTKPPGTKVAITLKSKKPKRT